MFWNGISNPANTASFRIFYSLLLSVVTVQLVPVSVPYEAYSVSNVPQYVTFVPIENFALAECSFCSRANIQQMVLESVSQMLFRG